MSEATIYRSVAEIEEVVSRFENCEYQPEEFFHARHLTVAARYFLRLGTSAAKERMREGLKRFIAFHGKQGYHVTITEFWLGQVEATLARVGTAGEAVAIVNQVVAPLCEKSLIYEYYSRERIGSAEAKAGLVDPDVKALPEEMARSGGGRLLASGAEAQSFIAPSRHG
jgi:hypothetical protein